MDRYHGFHVSAGFVAPLLSVEPNSVLAKNLEFMAAYPDEFTALEATDVWFIP